jgi:hypothetical protein
MSPIWVRFGLEFLLAAGFYEKTFALSMMLKANSFS